MGLLGGRKQQNQEVSTDTLTKDELEHLLFALSESTFRGKDVHLLSSIVAKLTNQLKTK
tara:strand:- start:7459 stop:7635 length:177 start_codon:yes stop_codon:yes gene_type:complete